MLSIFVKTGAIIFELLKFAHTQAGKINPCREWMNQNDTKPRTQCYNFSIIDVISVILYSQACNIFSIN